MTQLTPFEEIIYEALQKAPEGLSFEKFAELKVPVKPPKNPANRLAVHMRTLRRKLGVTVESVRGVGYKLVK